MILYWLLGIAVIVMAWAVWGFLAALVAFAVTLSVHKLVWFNTKRVAARNAVYAALTYRQLDPSGQGAVDGRAANICERLGVRIESLGPTFPMSGAAEPSPLCKPAAVFALRSLAMHELGIPPIGTDVPRWYVLRNPFVASLAGPLVMKFRRDVERKFHVSLDELDEFQDS